MILFHTRPVGGRFRPFAGPLRHDTSLPALCMNVPVVSTLVPSMVHALPFYALNKTAAGSLFTGPADNSVCMCLLLPFLLRLSGMCARTNTSRETTKRARGEIKPGKGAHS